ncbi:MAG: hypothetical protein EU540_05190 [Promethearchaeota archaeon]|nr:MAG: hypothetical protein EU540_05190 [Candidatus Lokiarchaeota archaeon]
MVTELKLREDIKIHPKNDRIQRLREKYQTDIPKISIQRAKYYTDKWFETENSNLSLNERVALSMLHVYENMTHYVNSEDKIAGYWTESFLGVPIDIERGVFNNVYKNELKKGRMFKLRVKSLSKTLGFLIRKRQLGNFRHNIKIVKSMGKQPTDLSITTMDKREINPYTIDKEDLEILLKDLLPKWKGKSIIDILDKEMQSSNLIKDSVLDFFSAVPAVTSRQLIFTSLCSNLATFQGHLILDYEKVIKEGLLKMKDDIEKTKVNTNTKEELDFLNSISIAVDGIIAYCKRLKEKLENQISIEKNAELKENLKEVLNICKKVPLHPAKSFREAVQSAWTLKVAVELAHPINLNCFGRVDQIFYPYYKRDKEKGIISEAEAVEIFEELLLKLMSLNIRPESNTIANFYHRYLGSTPITLGGVKPDGTDSTNDLTYLFIDAANGSRAVSNISVRVNEKTPDDLLLKIAEALNEGSANISIYNDEVNIEAMKRRGFSEEDARDYAIIGCVELNCPGKTGAMSGNALLLCRLLDMTLRNGDTQTLFGMLREAGIKTGDPNKFETFEDFMDAFYQQAKDQIELIVKGSNFRDEIYAKNQPAPYISAFMDGCLQNKRDVTEGGAKYDLSAIGVTNSIANLIDSLYAIKKIIFEDKFTTFDELLDALDNNFVGYEDLHNRIMEIEGFWGNGNAEVDEFAHSISKTLFEEIYKYKNYRGGPFIPILLSMTTHTIDGRISIATPDGRLASSPYAPSCSPYNVEKNGVTGVFRSIASLDFENSLGSAVNVKFHPSALGSELETRKKWVSLVKTYFQLGGPQVQPTVA